MQRPPRCYPHTRKEWAGIREQFTRLYQAESKKLSEVVEILGEQGFHAEKHHYKTYITKWGLKKNKKESEMIFALQKIQQRLPEKTVFKIRGHLHTFKDIEQYWKRKSLDSKSLPCVTSTPDGVEYRTPSPPLEGVPSDPQLLYDILDADTFSPDMSLEFDPSFDFNQRLLNIRRWPSPRLLSYPEPLRTAEQAFHYSKISIQLCIERESYEIDMQRANSLQVFYVKAYDAISAVEFSHSRIIVEAAQLDLFQAIPALAEQYSPRLLGILLEVISRCLSAAHKQGIKETGALGGQIVDRIGKAFTETHPLPLLLRAVNQSSSDALPILGRLLLASKDTLARVLGDQHSTTREMLEILFEVMSQNGDWDEAHSSAIELLQVELGIYETARTEDNLDRVLLAQLRLARCYKHTGYPKKAEELVENGLECCSGQMSPNTREYIRALYLADQGLLRASRGQVVEGIKSLSEALTICTRLWGPADTDAMWMAHEIQRLERVLWRGKSVRSCNEAGL